MKNVIALGLIACAAFTSTAHAGMGDNPITMSAEGACLSGVFDRAFSENISKIGSITKSSSEEFYNSLLDRFYAVHNNEVVKPCVEEFHKDGMDAFINNENTIAAWQESRAPKYVKILQDAARKLVSENDANNKLVQQKWDQERAAEAAKAKAEPKQQKVAQVAKQAAQVDCTDFESNAYILSEQMKASWQVLMDQRRDLKAQLDGVYSAREVNAIIKDNTAGLERDAEMASDRYTSYSKQCGQ